MRSDPWLAKCPHTETKGRLGCNTLRVHAAFGTVVVVVCLISWAGLEGYGRLQAAALVESLQRVGTPDVPAIVEQLSGYRRWPRSSPTA